MDIGDRLLMLLAVDPAKEAAVPPDDRSGFTATVACRCVQEKRAGSCFAPTKDDDGAGANEDLP
jgi:hypothetical protein